MAVKTKFVVVEGVTEAEPDAPTFPSIGSTVTDVAPLVAQFRVAEAPVVICGDDAEKEEMTGGVPTTTVACPVTVPLALVADKVYVVVDVGLTKAIPLSATFPIPGAMVTEVAPLVAQVKVRGTAADAEKEVMTGGVPTTTVVCPVTVPLALVAVNVYVVVDAGLTEAPPLSATVPIPGAMVTEVAPLVAQVNV